MRTLITSTCEKKLSQNCVSVSLAGTNRLIVLLRMGERDVSRRAAAASWAWGKGGFEWRLGVRGGREETGCRRGPSPKRGSPASIKRERRENAPRGVRPLQGRR